MEYIANEIKVSVIVPVYNVEEYLTRCVNSLLRQTLRNIEIILVDDESPDRCPQICDAYAEKEKRIKVIHKKNGGLGYARNSGIDVATGEYVAFLDSDDYVDDDTYEWLYAQAKEAGADAIFYNYETFDDNGQICGHHSDRSITLYDTADSVKQLMLDMIGALPHECKDRNVQMSSCTAFYKRSVVDGYKVRFLSERELISEDLLFNMDFLAHASNVVRTNCSFYHYYVNTASLTHRVRLDRVERNVQFYSYVQEKIKSDPDYQVQDSFRAMRMLIGYCRSSIMQVVKSALPVQEKNEWLQKVCELPVWEKVYSAYPVARLPLKYGLFFWAQYKKQYWLMKLMSKLS